MDEYNAHSKNNQLIAIIVTIICPPIGLFISLFALRKDFVNWKTYIFCVAWAMAIFAYCYESTTASDLVRYYQYVELLKGTSLLEAFEIGQYGKDNLYSFVFVCWIVAKLGDIRLLPAISTFSVYLIGLFVTCRIGEDIDADRKERFKYIVVIMLAVSFYAIVNNVRNVWAFSLLGFAVFRDVYQKKRNWLTLFFYVFPVFLHTSAVIFIIIRFIMIAPKKIKIICSVLCLLVPMTLNILSTQLKGITTGNIVLNILLEMVQSGNNYFEHTTSSWALIVQNSGSEKLSKIIYMSIALLLFVEYFFLLKKSKNEDGLLADSCVYKIIDFPFLACLLTFSCMTMVMPEYWRFVVIAILFGGSIVLTSSAYGINRILNKGILLLSSVGAVIWIRNIFIYSDVVSMTLRSLLANPFVLFVLKLTGKGIDIIS